MRPHETWIGRLLSRWFKYTAMDGRGQVKRFNKRLRTMVVITQKPVCPKSLHRWTVTYSKQRAIYIHAWEGDDWTLDYHDHSSDMWSIGLWGSYIEEHPDGTSQRYRAPWVRWFPATHQHRIRVPGKPCWTLVIGGPRVRGSRFIDRNTKAEIGVDQYLFTGLGKRQRSC